MLRRRIGVGPLLTIPQPLSLGGVLRLSPALDLTQSLRGALAQLQSLFGRSQCLSRQIQLALLLTSHR